MKKKLSLSIALLVSIFQVFSVYAVTIPETAKQEAMALEIEALGAILIDATTGDILYQKNIDERLYPASITKLMTVLLALEYGKLDEVMTFSYEATHSIPYNSSHISVDTNEQLTIEQGLYAIMLQSANEVSNGVGEHISGSMDAFAVKMTERAKEIGCTSTNFVNAHGLHSDDHYTTARDMTLIAQELLKHKFFIELMGVTYYEIPPTNVQPETRNLYNQNQLIRQSSIFYYENSLGGKTGFTDESGNTLVSFAKQGETTLISVVLKSTGYGNSYKDTAKLFDYGFNNFETKTIAKKGDSPAHITVIETQTRKTLTLGPVTISYPSDIVVTVPKNTPISSIVPTYNLQETYEAPIRQGELVTNVSFKLDNDIIATCNLVADSTLLPTTSPENNAPKNAPISPIVVFFLLFVAISIIIGVRIVVSKIEYENRRKRRRQRLQKLRDNPININKKL